MPKLHSVPPPKTAARRPATASVEIHRELGWVEVTWGHYKLHELSAYWARPSVFHRWRRLEATSRSVSVGPLTILMRRPTDEQPHLTSIPGGKA